MVTIARAFGWFQDHNALLDCVTGVQGRAAVSVLMPNPETHESHVVVLGPLSHDFACYPFLDMWHHILRLGMDRSLARHYAEILFKGGVVICVEDNRNNPTTWLQHYPVHDMALVP